MFPSIDRAEPGLQRLTAAPQEAYPCAFALAEADGRHGWSLSLTGRSARLCAVRKRWTADSIMTRRRDTVAYFPFFMDVSAGDGLIVGGGRVALRKVQKLLDFDARLTVCAPSILPEIEAVPGLTLLRQPFEPSLLDGKLFVISATADNVLNTEIAALCRERNIPVNAVDDRENCTFLFPALVKRGSLSIGISTGGASPSAAVYWKKRISDLIPQDAGDILNHLSNLREAVKEAIPDEKKRAEVFSSLFDVCMKSGPISEEALTRILDQSKGETP